MAITSIKLNALEIGVGLSYRVGQEALETLLAAPPREPVLVDRPGTYPKFIRSQIMPKPITLPILLVRGTLALRSTDFAALSAATANGDLVPLVYVKDGQTFTYQATCGGPVPDVWYERAIIEAIIPNPIPVIT